MGAVVALMVTAAACTRPELPESGTPTVKLYEEKCSGCHAAHHPKVLTAASWEMVLPRMERNIAVAGRSLSADESRQIREYLLRHAR